MSFVLSARTHMGLSQSYLAGWINARSGFRANAKQISDWECGIKQPRKEIRELLSPYAAREVIKQLNNQPDSNHESIIVEMMK